MVIHENAGMLTAGNNQYLQPGYLSSIPSQLDSKKSPLALLAKSCSSIGADSTELIPSEKKKEGDEIKKEKSTPTSVEIIRRSPAFRPYENTTKRESVLSSEEKVKGTVTPSRDSSSIRTHSNSSSSERAERTKEEGGRTSREGATSSPSITPIIRSGLEVLAGYPKDLPLGTYRAGLPQSFLPPGYPSLENHPAFRGAHPGLLASLYPSSLSSIYQSQAAAAALYSSAGLSVPSTTPSLLSSPYLSYTRVRLSGGGETVVPVCRDPYCTGCAYSLQNNHLLLTNGTCPLSCIQCEQAKAALRAMPGLSSLPASSIVPASSLLPQSSTMSAAAVAASLYPSVSASSLLSGQPDYRSLLSNPLQAHAHLLGAHSPLAGHRPGLHYPPGAISPLTAAAAARYNPYAKPVSSLSSLVGSALAPTLPGLSPYASSLAAYPPGFHSPYAGLYPRS